MIYVRGEVEPWQCGKEVGTSAADEDDMATLMPLIEKYSEHFGMTAEEVLAVSFTKIVPISHRQYGKLYTYV